VCFGTAVAVVFAVAAVRNAEENSPSTLLRDVNAFEDQPVFSAEWSQKDLQHHLVSTQQQQTAENSKLDAGIEALDHKVEIIMDMLKHRPVGKSGFQGSRGQAGPQGPRGAQGSVGPAGAPGHPGFVGQEGLAGADGPAGPPGAPGSQGAPGVQGRVGDPGWQGEDGAQGPRGATGQRGALGDVGLEGPPGAPGFPSPLQVHHYVSDGLSGDAAATPALARAAARQATVHASVHTGADAGARRGGALRLAERAARAGEYRLEVVGPPGDDLEVGVRGADGYHAEFRGTGRVRTERLPVAADGRADIARVRDDASGATRYFRLSGQPVRARRE
jgi:hypothetical protein